MSLKEEQIKEAFRDVESLELGGIWFRGERGEREYLQKWFGSGLKEHSFYKDGHQYGEQKTWFFNGEPSAHYWIYNGKFENEFREWRSNKLKSFKMYKDGNIVADFIKNPELKTKYGVVDADLDM